MSASTDWFFWAALSACFAALTAIFFVLSFVTRVYADARRGQGLRDGRGRLFVNNAVALLSFWLALQTASIAS